MAAGVPAGNWYAFLRKLVQVTVDCTVLAARVGRTALKRKGMTCPVRPVLYLFPKPMGLIQLESRSESTAKLMSANTARPQTMAGSTAYERHAWYVPVIVSASF